MYQGNCFEWRFAAFFFFFFFFEKEIRQSADTKVQGRSNCQQNRLFFFQGGVVVTAAQL